MEKNSCFVEAQCPVSSATLRRCLSVSAFHGNLGQQFHLLGPRVYINTALQSAIAKTNARSDKYHQHVSCGFSDKTLAQYIDSLVQSEAEGRPSVAHRQSAFKIDTKRCVELLQLELDYAWPITLVINPLFLGKMNCIFRLLLWCKVLERGLNRTWFTRNSQTVHAAADQAAADQAYKKMLSVRHQMLQFLRQFQFYAFNFVLEPQWRRMQEKVAAVNSVSDIMSATSTFFQETFAGLVLSNKHGFLCLVKLFDGIQVFVDRMRDLMPLAGSAKESHLMMRFETEFLRGLSDLANPETPEYSALMPLLTWVDFSRFYERQDVYCVLHSSAVSDSGAPTSSRLQSQRSYNEEEE